MKNIFVHLGKSKADYLWENIKYLRKIAPQEETILIIDNKIHLNKLDSLACKIFHYDAGDVLNESLDSLHHNIEFRNGFWRSSIERFFALQQWHRLNPDESFLHIESDNLVLPNFPWEKFKKIDSLAWLQHNDKYDCAALFYSPNLKSTNWLIDEIINQIELDKSLTDMRVLSLISQQYPKKVELLPSYNPNWIVKEFELNLKAKVSNSFEKFGGIFDPAAIGVWLTGNDPRNSFGWIKRYKNHFNPIVDPSVFSFSISDGVVNLSHHGISSQLFNLHIHSKQKLLFGKFNKVLLRFYIHSSQKQKFPRFYNFVCAYHIAKDLCKIHKFNLINVFKGIYTLFRTRNTELFN
jgi:hypothetical protein